MKRLSILACLGLLIVTSAPLLAQGNPQTREGFWISFGFGAGSAAPNCDGCDFDREVGLSGYLRMGGTIRPNFLLGGETNGWSHSDDGLEQGLAFISAVGYFYPAVQSGFWLKGALGLASYAADDGADELTALGLGVGGGLGYDIRLRPNFSLTPYLNYLRQIGGELEFNGIGLGENANLDLFQVGLGFSWH